MNGIQIEEIRERSRIIDGIRMEEIRERLRRLGWEELDRNLAGRYFFCDPGQPSRIATLKESDEGVLLFSKDSAEPARFITFSKFTEIENTGALNCTPEANHGTRGSQIGLFY